MDLGGSRILIIEDEALIMMMAVDMVERLGGIVAAQATSIEAAWNKIKEPSLHCVMLDVNLRGASSLDIAAELLKQDIPFFFCTAYVHAFEGFGHVPRVVKPYDEEDLAQVFRAVLGNRMLI